MMKKYINLSIVLVLLVGLSAFAQQTPAPNQTTAMSITRVTAHIGDGTVINNATIVFENGKITAIGDASTVTAGTVVDASGQHIYPGIIAPAKSLGLVEVDAVRASNDQDEIGEMIPHIRSLIAYNAESKVVESMRPNGVLIAQIAPQGGTISGTSSIVQLDAWNWEDAAVKVDDGIHMRWPSSFRRGRWWLGEPRGFKPNDNYAKDIEKIRSFFTTAKAYENSETNGGEHNLAYSATQGIFDGSQQLFVSANGEKEIIDAVTFCKEMGIQKMVIVGGYNAHKITDFLKQNNIAVLVGQPHAQPSMEDHDYDHNYKLPKLLMDAGLLVGIQNSRMSNFQTRNMPFYAGQVAGQGLDKEKALQLITGNNAKILGIDADYGTLTVGKSATFFVSQGDALDMRTNLLTYAFIDGRKLSLETHQTELWKRYTEKYSKQ